jgi:HemY protein
VIRLFIYSLVALVIGGALALLLSADPGYVLVNFRGTTVEATLATVIVSAILLVVLAKFLLYVLRLLNPRNWFSLGWLRRPPAQVTGEGVQLLLLGRWQEAYKRLVENAERLEIPELNYLLAAVAAYQRGDSTAWHWCLDQAERAAPGKDPGLKSFRAWLDTREGHPELALPLLQSVLQMVPASPFVLAQIKDIYVAQGRWDELAALLPELEKHKVVEGTQLQQLAARTHASHLELAPSIDSLRTAWQALPKALKHDDKLVGLYARRLLGFGEDAEAGSLLTAHLKKDWSDALVTTLGFVNVRNPQDALATMEAWHRQHPDNAALLLTLGRLSLRNQLWGKAREYFEQGLRVTQSPEQVVQLNAELARLYEQLGEHERSLDCYRKALGLQKHPLPNVPLPSKR